MWHSNRTKSASSRIHNEWGISIILQGGKYCQRKLIILLDQHPGFSKICLPKDELNGNVSDKTMISRCRTRRVPRVPPLYSSYRIRLVSSTLPAHLRPSALFMSRPYSRTYAQRSGSSQPASPSLAAYRRGRLQVCRLTPLGCSG
jgi:hypothetical protein